MDASLFAEPDPIGACGEFSGGCDCNSCDAACGKLNGGSCDQVCCGDPWNSPTPGASPTASYLMGMLVLTPAMVAPRPAPRRTLVLAPDAGHAGNPLLSTMAVPAPADAVPLCAFVQPLWPPGCPALWADPWFPRRPGSHHALHQGSTAWHTRSARWAGATLNSGPTDRRHRPQRGLAVIDHDRQRCASNGWPAASNMAAASLRRRCASASRCSALAMWARISTRDACHAVPSHSASDRSATFR